MIMYVYISRIADMIAGKTDINLTSKIFREIAEYISVGEFMKHLYFATNRIDFMNFEIV